MLACVCMLDFGVITPPASGAGSCIQNLTQCSFTVCVVVRTAYSNPCYASYVKSSSQYLTLQGKTGRHYVFCREWQDFAERISQVGATIRVRERACGSSMADAAATKTGFVRKINARESAVTLHQMVSDFTFYHNLLIIWSMCFLVYTATSAEAI